MRLLVSLSLVIYLSACAYKGNKSIVLPPGQDYLVINNGRVHRSCLVKFGQKLLTIINESSDEGLQCLQSLQGEGAKLKLRDLNKLFSDKTISYSCQEIDYKWDHAAAHASLNKTWNVPSYDLYHPYISVNPSSVLGDSDVKGSAIPEFFLKKVLFHESFHLLGSYHALTPEFAYACEECCFPRSSETKPAACKICSSQYDGISDPQYLLDVWGWANQSIYKKSIGREVILRNALIEKPGSEFHLKYFFENSGLGNLIFNYLPAPGHRDQKFEKEADSLRPFAKIIASIEYELYFRGKVSGPTKSYLNLNISALAKALSSENALEKGYAIKIWDSVLYDMETILTRLTIKRDPEYKNFLKMHSTVYRLLKSH